MIKMTVGQRKIYANQNSEAKNYWTNLLSGVAASCFRPDIPGGEQGVPENQCSNIQLPIEVGNRFRQVGKNNPTAMQLLLTASVAMLYHIYTGEDDLLLGNPARDGDNAMPLRLSIFGEDTFSLVSKRLLLQHKESLSWLDFPLELTGVETQIIVGFTEVTRDRIIRGKEEMLFEVADDGEILTLYLSANADRFNMATLARINAHLIALFTMSLESPDCPLDEFDLMLDIDHQVLNKVNDTQRYFPNKSLPDLFGESFLKYAHKTAIHDREHNYTYSELDVASDNIASLLISSGITANNVVAVVAQRSFEMIAAIIGILKAGAAYLPIAPDLPQSRIEYIINDSQANMILAQPEWLEVLPSGQKIIELTNSSINSTSKFLPVNVSPHDAAYVIYTSGSTGKPKGVVIEHLSVVNRLKWMQSISPLSEGDVILQKTTISFDVSVWELFWWLLEGASLSLLSPGGEREPSEVVAVIEQHQITTIHFVPTMLGAFLKYIATTEECGRISSLKNVFSSGESLGKHHVEAFTDLVPSARLINLYGPTEATVDVSWQLTSSENPIVTIGKPIDNTRLYVLDKKMRECPVGVSGELYIAGACLARHYLHRPELTAERFVSGKQENRLYKTGDLVRWLDNGELEYIGRNDDQIKLRGFRIELGEVEHALLEEPCIIEAKAIVRENFDEQAKLLAYVISQGEVSEQNILSRIRNLLPSYMIPDHIINVESFPLSPTGKLNIKALPEPDILQGEFIAPRNESERLLAAIWCEVLGFERIGVTESFFSLGGNSIHFVSVLAKAKKGGFKFTFQMLFKYPTIEALLAHSHESADGDAMPQEYGSFELIGSEDYSKIPAGIEDAYPMSMLQAGLIYQSKIMHGNTNYHDIVSYLIQGSIEPHILKEAMRVVVAENAVFRTSYHLKEFSEYLQLVHSQVEDLPLVINDLRHLTTNDEQELWYESWFDEEQKRDFKWENPGLVRLHVHIIKNDLYRYSISQHNSALDGWSMNQLHTRLFSIYYSLLEGKKCTIEKRDNHVRNFIGLEQYALNSSAHVSFWQNKMEDYPHTIIPRLRPSKEDIVPDVVFQDIILPVGLSDRIIELAQKVGVPVKNILLATHLKVHAMLNADQDILTGYEHGGRPELPGADSALGVFLNTLPLRVKITNGSWLDLIKQTYQAEAELLPYRRYPMAKIKQDLRLKEVLFETVFNFTHFYALKELKKLPEFSLLEVRAAAITEFPLRMEFSQHFYTDEVMVSLHYHSGEFDKPQICTIGNYIVRILECMTERLDESHNVDFLLSDPEILMLQGFSENHPESAKVVDSFGNLSPIGTQGNVIKGKGPLLSKCLQGKWLPDGTLWCDNKMLENEKITEPSHVVETSNSPLLAGVMLPVMTQKVLTVWSDVLNIDPVICNLEDDFFEVGGNSLTAMRLVMLLDGIITLRDMMQYSRLGELCNIAEQNIPINEHQHSSSLLVKLSDSEHTTTSFICMPYAGGNALHFLPFAKELNVLLPDINVMGVELPGHDLAHDDSKLQSFSGVAESLVEEIAKLGSESVYLWGHCVGTALAIDVTKRLSERGIEVSHLFLAAKLLSPAKSIRDTLYNAQNLCFGDIRHLYEEWSGEDDLKMLSEQVQCFMTNIFRHDSLEANKYLLSQLEHVGKKTEVPTSLVVACDDPATKGYAANYRSWLTLVENIELLELDEGGHYFMRTQPQNVANLIKQSVIKYSLQPVQLEEYS